MTGKARLLLIVICLFLVSPPASAYDFIGAKWADNQIPVAYWINQAGSADVSGNSDIEAVKSSFSTWEDVSCSYIAFDYKGTTSSTTAGIAYDDGMNNNVWRESSWPREYGSEAIAVTTPLQMGQYIMDADIQYNGVNYRWATDGSYMAMDVANVATHEIGHVIGLGDIYDWNYSTSTMFGMTGPGTTSARSLAQDDINGICALYPDSSTPGDIGSRCSGSGDCASGLLCLDDPSGDYCSKKCQSNSDCPSGYTCQDYAQSSTGKACKHGQPEEGEKGDPCDQQSPCAGGYTCVLLEQGAQSGTCLQSCNPQSSSCPANEECYPLQDEQGNVVGGACFQPPSGTVPLGGTCDQNNLCQQGLLCVLVEQGTQSGMCLQKCDPANPMCPAGEECYQIQGSSEGVCYKKQTGNVAEGGVCDDNNLCRENLICILEQQGDASGECYRECNPQNPACLEGETCASASGAGFCWNEPSGIVPLNGMCNTENFCMDGLVCVLMNAEGGQCLQSCDPQSQICPPGQTCYTLRDTSGNVLGGACSAPPPGDVEEGGTCDAQSTCVETTLCIPDSEGAQTGICRKICGMHADCAAGLSCQQITGASVCLPGNPPTNDGNMGFRCTDGSQCTSGMCMEIEFEKACTRECIPQYDDCPAGYVCTAVEGMSVCWPPEGFGGLGGPSGVSCGSCAAAGGAAGFEHAALLLGLVVIFRARRKRKSVSERR